MVPVNNSDLAWLITADYNQDNGKYHEELREDVINPDVNGGDWEFRCLLINRTENNFVVYYAGAVHGENVGGSVRSSSSVVGGGDLGNIGGFSGHWTEDRYPPLVGGNYDNPRDNYVC